MLLSTGFIQLESASFFDIILDSIIPDRTFVIDQYLTVKLLAQVRNRLDDRSDRNPASKRSEPRSTTLDVDMCSLHDLINFLSS